MDTIRSHTEIKLTTARQKKDVGDQAFKQGDTKEGTYYYHQALMYVLGIDKSGLQSLGITSPPTSASDATKDPKTKEKTEVDEIVEKIYANMSACHIKNQNWKRAVETADKALSKNEENYKAMFRKAKALGEQGFFEKASKILEDLKSKSSADAPAASAELARLKAIDDERERAHKHKMKGFLNKKKEDKSTVQD
ncbi:TPR-like protein [Macrolepiota fuliginosa MF-IS2]|uniref:TPR-like protein n=1 Tax=Macrolepiota fuliginosa MF-IS2 TaxID=1400762 RepID=A0A9P6BZT1_9AGAR|nr:TPR-like protein [Macrolepiota fuliginosa MF-IS2]